MWKNAENYRNLEDKKKPGEMIVPLIFSAGTAVVIYIGNNKQTQLDTRQSLGQKQEPKQIK